MKLFGKLYVYVCIIVCICILYVYVGKVLPPKQGNVVCAVQKFIYGVTLNMILKCLNVQQLNVKYLAA